MLLPGHLAAGYLMTYLILKLLNVDLDPSQINLLLVCGALLGNAPDLDMFLHLFRLGSLKVKEAAKHRDYITHTPIFWLILGLLIYFLTTHPVLKLAGLLIWIIPWGHFILDSVEYGIRWLYPFSNKYFFIHRAKWVKVSRRFSAMKFYKTIFLKTYMKGWTFCIEILIILTALYVLFFVPF